MSFFAPIPIFRWDIFCSVIDNYGDIGVCWRLARQLSTEYGMSVRLFVDNLGAFQTLCPAIDPVLKTQQVDEITIIHWESDSSGIERSLDLVCDSVFIAAPADVVISAFSCRLPDLFLQAMAAQTNPPIWINLDYLSAESWVLSCHKQPSPHPKLPLVSYFFFPGFTETTGGLLREKTLVEQRTRFVASDKADFFNRVGLTLPPADAFLISLFSYANEALEPLLHAWSNSQRLIHCFAASTHALPSLSAFAGRRLRTGDVVQRGALTLEIIPFFAQPDYDRLLWLSDLNFVRGEDSFVRAQWAANPLIWHIYPQDDDAHLTKLAAFLALYCENLDAASASALRSFSWFWNGKCLSDEPKKESSQNQWNAFVKALPALKTHAQFWANAQLKQEDLCGQLVRFSLSKL